MTKYALHVAIKAKAGREEEVAAFLASAEGLVAAEPKTLAWFAVRFDQQNFAIFDAFDTEDDRNAHLAGKVAAALVERAPDLFEGMPEIQRPEVLADKLPG